MLKEQKIPQDVTGTKVNIDYFRNFEVGITNNIVINLPNAKINFHKSLSSKVEATLRGTVRVIGEDVKCRVNRKGKNFVIVLYAQEEIIDASIRLDIYLPIKEYNLISIISTNANICIDEGIYAKKFMIRTTSGMVKSYMTFKNAIFESQGASIDVELFAESDVKASIFTESGDINLKLLYIKKALIDTFTKTGNVSNEHSETRGYTALMDISSISGNISIN